MNDPVTYSIPDARPHIEVEVPDPKEKVPCPECGKYVQRDYLRTHELDMHRRKKAPKRPVGRPRKNGDPPQPRKPRPLNGNDVVNTVLEVIFPHGIPVRHRELVNAWCEATIDLVKRTQ